MSDNPENAVNPSESSESKPSISIDDLQKQVEEMQARISELNNESAARRVENKRLAEERDALKAAQMKQLEEQGNYKAIAEERAKKLAELESYQERATALEETIREANEARIKSIPEHMRGLVPTDYPPEKLARWLDANQQVFSRPSAPNLGAGVSGGNGVSIELTPLQKQIAERMGMSPEDYAKALKAMGQ